MKKILVTIMAGIMALTGITVTGCTKDEEIVLRDYHGYYGEYAYRACEEARNEYIDGGYEVTEIIEEKLGTGNETVYCFYTLYRVAG